MSNEIFVIGHKNPDTDSICSAIAYAYLKGKISDNIYIPKRAGDLNPETKFVLEYFNISSPEYIADVKTQVRDVEIKPIEASSPDISLKKAWQIMKSLGIATLPVSKDGQGLSGIITVGDITQSYMDMYDSMVLSRAKTTYKNVLEVLDGVMITDEVDKYIQAGNVLIGAMNPDVMESYISKGDIVILGNRYESQLCAIEMGAQCLIVTGGLPVSTSIRKLAELNKCTIISTDYDTYTAARAINQSIPIGYFMKAEELTVFSLDDTIEEIRDIMVNKRFRNFPIVDENNTFVGLISRASLINMTRKNVILVDHNERLQSVEGLEEALVLEIIDHHRIGDIQTVSPVYFRNQPLGSTSTIVASIYKENGVVIPENIAGILCAAIISDTLMFKSPTCTSYDIEIAKNLAELAQINIEEFSARMFRAGASLDTKTDQEIFYQDFKQFNAGKLALGVGQINSIDNEILEKIKERMIPFMKKVYKERPYDMILFMLTNIMEESTELIFIGSNKEIINTAFNIEVKDNCVRLPGVVSRKKQVIPPILNAINK